MRGTPSIPEDGASAGVESVPLKASLSGARHADGTGRWQLRQCCSHDNPQRSRSGTSSSCRRAPLAFVGTTPCLLRNRPALHPIGKSCITIVWLGRRDASSTLVWAAFAMDPTAPLLLGDRPTCLPIRETICAIVGIRWSRRLRRLATDVLVLTAPGLLALVPCKILPDGAIVGIDRSCWCRWRCWRRQRPSRRPRRRRRRWRSWWRRGKRCGRNCLWCLWQSCGRAPPTNGHTAIIFLRLGPCSLNEITTTSSTSHTSHAHASSAIVWQRGCVN